MKGLHLFLELFTLASFLATGAWAAHRFGRDGAWLAGFLTVLGAVRESWVVLQRYLYEFADLYLKIGRTPLIAAVIWGFAILCGVAAVEALTGRVLRPDRVPDLPQLAWLALFMVALAGFFEPFLALVEMARWEAGTAALAGVPKIALVGYPTFAVGSLAASGWLLGRFQRALPRALSLAVAVPALAVGHAWGLAQLKVLLGW
jgi:hypothetical protein